jgi:hypothetical protein
MRALRESVLGGLGFLLGGAFVLLQLGLFAGGLSYREECLNGGKIEKNWTFTWFAPIPYVFRPDPGPNCVVHTGTRVALNGVGMATFQPTTAAIIADQSATRTGDPTAPYLAKLSASLRDYTERIDTTRTFAEGMHNVETLVDELEALEPPERYASAHSDLLAAATAIRAEARSMRKAADSGERTAFDRAQGRIEEAAHRLEEAVQQLQRLEATG